MYTLVSCSCDEPKDWTTQTIPLTNLEKVEIKGFEGQDHEFDFLKLIFRCAPVLKKVGLELSEGFIPNDDWCTEIQNTFMAYPSVEYSVDHCPGKQVPCTHSYMKQKNFSTVSSKDKIIDVNLVSIFCSQTFIAMSSQCLPCCESV
jgi:hypothetical protein